MAQFLDKQPHRLTLHYEEPNGNVLDLDGSVDVTRCTTAAEVRAKIVAGRLGAHPSLPSLPGLRIKILNICLACRKDQRCGTLEGGTHRGHKTKHSEE